VFWPYGIATCIQTIMEFQNTKLLLKPVLIISLLFPRLYISAKNSIIWFSFLLIESFHADRYLYQKYESLVWGGEETQKEKVVYINIIQLRSIGIEWAKVFKLVNFAPLYSCSKFHTLSWRPRREGVVAIVRLLGHAISHLFKCHHVENIN